jgi:5'-deoxynucleotidase YfbR-like HD superfamily hydrolase
MKPDLERLLELQRLLAAFSNVERVAMRKHKGTFIAENDTEHSYNLAMTAWFLCQYFPELDKDLVIRYALIHDMVEVHAGDTYIYGTDEEKASKSQREADALKKLQSDWQDFIDMTDTIELYETRPDAESKFVYALDKIMPVMLIYIHDGHTWKEQKVTVDMLYKAKVNKIKLSPEIMPYFNDLHALLLDHPELINKI